MKAPDPIKLPTDHDPATCRECAAAHRDMQRWLARLARLCRCCGVLIHGESVVYVVGDLDVPSSHWRMCGTCWRAGYQVGETLDRSEPPT